MQDNTARIIEMPYCPRPLQTELHEQRERFSVYNIHRRFGKTVFALNELIRDIVECPNHKPRGAYIAPLYKQAKNIAWEYLKDFTRVIPGMNYNESELRADFPGGGRIILLGGENVDAIRGIYLDSCVLDETAQLPPSLFTTVIRPLLADRKGKCIFIGTPFGQANQFYRLYQQAADLPGWTRQTLKAEDTGYIDAEELEAARREMSPEEYDQEFNCSWSAAIKGAFYAKEMAEAEEQGRITHVPYDELLPVITSWDLGVKDATVVWYWQLAGSQIRAIRCDAFQGMRLSQIIQQVGSYNYRFSAHIAPHDIAVRELGAGSRRQQALKLGVKFIDAPKPAEVSRRSGINEVKTIIPRIWFDRENCKDGIEALKVYRTEYNEKLQIFSDNPLHDWSSDYADSVRYFAITRNKAANQYNQQELDYSQTDKGVF